MVKESRRLSLPCPAPLIKAAAFLTCFVLSQPAFAQDVNQALGRMTTIAENLRKAFTSDLVKAILGIALCAAGLTYAANKDNDKVKRNCIAVIVGASIIMAATFFVDFLMD